MRKELADVYENLFLDYPYGLRDVYRPFYFRSIDISRLIHRQIVIEEDKFIRLGQEDQTRSVQLRSDAKYFLMLIFYQMIALPLQHPDLAEQVDPDKLRDYIISDINLLLSFSYDEKLDAETKEVTAHTVVTAIDKNWDRLNISNFKLWNR